MLCLFLLYNVLNQYTQTPSLLSLPPTLSFHPSRPWQSVTQQLPTSCLFHTWSCLYVNATLSIHLPLLGPPSHVSTSPQLCLYYCPENRLYFFCFCFSMPTRWGVSTLTWYPHEITNNVNFHHLVKVPFARFLHWKIVILPIPYSMFWRQVIKSSLPWSVGSGTGI